MLLLTKGCQASRFVLDHLWKSFLSSPETTVTQAISTKSEVNKPEVAYLLGGHHIIIGVHVCSWLQMIKKKFSHLSFQAGWKENHATFMNELKNLQAEGLTTLGQSLRTAFDLLNLNRLVTGIDNYGQVG